MIKNDDKENNESINSTDTPSNKQANNENINYNDMFKVMFTNTSYEYNLDEEYKLIKEGVLMTLEEEIYNKMKNKILIYDIINSLKEEKENNIKFSIKNIENSIKEIKYDYKSWIEDIIICICIIEKNEKLEDLGIKKSEEKILESIYHSLPSDLSQEFHGNIGSSDKPIKNITLLIKFIRQKKQEEYNKKYNQKNITTLQRYRDQANNINGED
ncbi:hypothetical protein H8356DRAFT_1068669 [Neocallimastix lanati (nom. inval.)]|nr:hypothetical protein H8356DRAFT_1068669 [Neocallimastix sp. JGI-2020a]